MIKKKLADSYIPAGNSRSNAMIITTAMTIRVVSDFSSLYLNAMTIIKLLFIIKINGKFAYLNHDYYNAVSALSFL